MAKEIQFCDPNGAGGADYVVLLNAVGRWWNTSGTPAFEAFNAAHWTDYAITATEYAAAVFHADMPAAGAGVFNVVAFLQAGGSPADTDTAVASGEIEWDGSAVVPLSSRWAPTKLVDSTYTAEQYLKAAGACTAGADSGGPGSPAFKTLDGATTAVSGTADSSGNRSAISYNL